MKTKQTHRHNPIVQIFEQRPRPAQHAAVKEWESLEEVRSLLVELDLVPRMDVVMSMMVMEVLDLTEWVIDDCTVRSDQSYLSVLDPQMVSIH